MRVPTFMRNHAELRRLFPCSLLPSRDSWETSASYNDRTSSAQRIFFLTARAVLADSSHGAVTTAANSSRKASTDQHVEYGEERRGPCYATTAATTTLRDCRVGRFCALVAWSCSPSRSGCMPITTSGWKYGRFRELTGRRCGSR